MTHGGKDWERGGLAESPCRGGAWISIPSSGGSERGLLSCSPWRWARGLQVGQVRMGVFQARLKGGGGTRGTGQMVMEEGQHRCLPAHRCMPGEKVKCSSFPPQVPDKVFRSYHLLASTTLNFSKEQHPFLKDMVILISCSMGWPLVEEAGRGAGQASGVPREETTEPKMRTSASQGGLPSQESTMSNTTDPLVLTSRTHSKALSSPGTNHCCALFSREKRDFK